LPAGAKITRNGKPNAVVGSQMAQQLGNNRASLLPPDSVKHSQLTAGSKIELSVPTAAINRDGRNDLPVAGIFQ